MKSTLAITAGCLLAALAVGDTVYRISPRAGRTYPDVLALKGGVGDISQLTDKDDEADASLDELFARSNHDGLDADELASIRQLALIAKPQESSWGEEFFKDSDGHVGGATSFAMADTTCAWDPTLGASMATSATTGPMSYFSSNSAGGGVGLIDMFALGGAGPGSEPKYGGGGGGGGGGGSSYRPSMIVSSLTPTPTVHAVPEPTSLSLVGLSAAMLLGRRRHRAR